MNLRSTIAISRPKLYIGFLIWGLACAIVANVIWAHADRGALTRLDAWLEYVGVTEIVTALVFRMLIDASPQKQGLGFSIVGLLVPFGLILATALTNLIEFKALEPPPLPAIQTPGLDYLLAFFWGCALAPFGIISSFAYWALYSRAKFPGPHP